MKKLTQALKITAASSILCLSASASADTGYYFGGNFASLKTTFDIIDDDTSLTAIYGRLGAQLNENISVETRLGFGVGDGDLHYQGIDINAEIDSLLGIYARAGAPVSESFYPYVIVGLLRGELSTSITGFGAASESETDMSYGVGADISVNDTSSVNVEYMNWFDKDGVEISGLSLGFTRKF